MRLIDADALIAEMHNVTLKDGDDRRTFYEVIERQPAIGGRTGRWIYKPNEGSYLVMSEDEINALIERCQQPEVIQRRDAFFAELDQMGITRNPDGSVEVEFTPKPPDSANALLREAADAIEELSRAVSVWAKRAMAWAEKAEEAHRWIPVTERLPNVDTNKSGYEDAVVIVAIQGWQNTRPMIYQRACVRGKTVYRWKWIWDRIYDGPPITHWMPLPEPPKEKR